MLNFLRLEELQQPGKLPAGTVLLFLFFLILVLNYLDVTFP